MNYCESSFEQIRYLERLKERNIKEVNSMQLGELIKVRSGGKEYYYEVDTNGERRSLNNHAERLALFQRKNLLQTQIENIEHNTSIIEAALKKYVPLTPLDSWWERIKSEQNPFRKESREIQYKGNFYRSKSEMSIAMFLTSYDIPFKYEVEVKINETRSRYPDFCIQRPKDKKMIYWEHCGLVGNDGYRKDLFYKLEEYHSIGIDLWDNLIISFDRYDGGLDGDKIERLIQLYLL